MIKFIRAIRMRLKQAYKTRFLLLKDNLEVTLKLRHPLVPPKRYNYINHGSNVVIGKEFLNHFITYGGLKPSDTVLEIGSGFGRMAIPLTGFLNEKGSYTGLEIIKDGVNWCQSKFTPNYPNFKFQHIDVYNERYNSKGIYKASEYSLPFGDNSFDFVYLTSVFTHMFTEGVEQYLSEIKRVLKTGGTCFITYFILNPISIKQIAEGKSKFSFKHQLNGCYIEDISKPEYAVAYTEETIKSFYNAYGLEIILPIHYGNWSRYQSSLVFQDIIVGKKTLKKNG